VLNRANGGKVLFAGDGDYSAFEEVLEQAHARYSVRLLSYCLMPNHWHLVVWPEDGDDEEVSHFMRWLTVTHTQRWHAYHGTTGTGHLYQGRFKSFLVQSDEHLLMLCRYVERNALRARLVARAEEWRWSSLWWRTCGHRQKSMILSDWPVERPRDWVRRVNQPETQTELDALRCCVRRSQPFGSKPWVDQMVGKLGLEWTVRPRGRPRKQQ